MSTRELRDGWARGGDMLTWLLQRFLYTLGCPDAAICQGAGGQCRGQGMATLAAHLGSTDTGSADSTPPGLHRAREAGRCAEEGAHDDAAGHVRHLPRRAGTWSDCLAHNTQTKPTTTQPTSANPSTTSAAPSPRRSTCSPAPHRPPKPRLP
ncbi:hypothetical protein IG631_02222 [Alternaria alternata]|jgi:hypothetical protein|nr:hypothetical protein IG631_02222 [Alternaria alternata]